MPYSRTEIWGLHEQIDALRRGLDACYANKHPNADVEANEIRKAISRTHFQHPGNDPFAGDRPINFHGYIATSVSRAVVRIAWDVLMMQRPWLEPWPKISEEITLWTYCEADIALGRAQANPEKPPSSSATKIKLTRGQKTLLNAMLKMNKGSFEDLRDVRDAWKNGEITDDGIRKRLKEIRDKIRDAGYYFTIGNNYEWEWIRRPDKN